MSELRKAVKTISCLDITHQDAENLAALYVELQREADKLGYGKKAANDQLFTMLEKRYGSGFAQWVVDRLGAVAGA